MKPDIATSAGSHHGPAPAVKSAGLGFSTAFMAVLVQLRNLSPLRPGTPLRHLALIAIDAACRSRGRSMTPAMKRAAIGMMELGALLNDRFDGDPHDPDALRHQTAWFKKSRHRPVIRTYAKRLRKLERSRPGHLAHPEVIRSYREQVNHLSLATLWSLARDCHLIAAEREIERDTDLRLLFQIVMLTQVIDDVLDVRRDRSREIPSFATPPDQTAAPLSKLIGRYSDTGPLMPNRDLCLQLAVRMVAAAARTVVRLRVGTICRTPPP